ncbi:hypothetical protein E2C01_059977 [Portunus trituberculatus]|uniref:Uncharacterized protein n=1 Tax=Portunus trituberculatus TaxID=210409 RepID=A0A5B7GZT0_PORTR|nr:hypothetical protein [Portunus trituberculatus]
MAQVHVYRACHLSKTNISYLVLMRVAALWPLCQQADVWRNKLRRKSATSCETRYSSRCWLRDIHVVDRDLMMYAVMFCVAVRDSYAVVLMVG